MNKGKVLIIDDEEIICTSCYRILVPEGYDVRCARSAIKGFDILESVPIDIVITDLKMPDIDGIEVLKRIKSRWPDIQVIMITGYHTLTASITSADEAIRKLGAFDYMDKPFTPDAIIEVVEKAMSHKKKIASPEP